MGVVSTTSNDAILLSTINDAMEVIATANNNNNNKMGKSGKQRNGKTNRISLGKFLAWKNGH